MGVHRCAHCVLPDTYPGLHLDAYGRCNLCPPPGQTVTVPRLGKDALIAAIEPYRRVSGKYDCLVGLSGGRDSTYLLYYAVRVLGLRVLALTIDNGFMPEQTRDNVRNATQILGVDHVIERHELVQRNARPVLAAWLRRPSPAMISFLCTGCRWGLYRGFLRAARHHRVPLILTGLGEPESGFATRLLARGPTNGLPALLRGLGSEIAANPWYLMLGPMLPYRIFMEYLYAGNLYAVASRDLMKRFMAPEMRLLKLFEYIAWDEQEILAVIRSELGWRNYEESQSSWRSDCKVNVLKNHLYFETLGFSKNDELVSNLIRMGTMTREEGLARVTKQNSVSPEFLSDVFGEVGIPYQKYREGLARIRAVRDSSATR